MPIGILYLLPVPLSDEMAFKWNDDEMAVLNNSTVVIAENLRTARRFIRAGGCARPFEEVTFYEMDKHKGYTVDNAWVKQMQNGAHAVLVSEAGCPCIGDPGYRTVMEAHRHSISVKPLSAKSAMTLALMASGLNASSYTFHGYLPVDKDPFHKKVKELQHMIKVQQNHAHVFIETPYRNDTMLAKLLAIADDNSMLCIVAALQTDQEMIQTQSIKQWRQHLPQLHKLPVVYVWGAGE